MHIHMHVANPAGTTEFGRSVDQYYLSRSTLMRLHLRLTVREQHHAKKSAGLLRNPLSNGSKWNWSATSDMSNQECWIKPFNSLTILLIRNVRRREYSVIEEYHYTHRLSYNHPTITRSALKDFLYHNCKASNNVKAQKRLHWVFHIEWEAQHEWQDSHGPRWHEFCQISLEISKHKTSCLFRNFFQIDKAQRYNRDPEPAQSVLRPCSPSRSFTCPTLCPQRQLAGFDGLWTSDVQSSLWPWVRYGLDCYGETDQRRWEDRNSQVQYYHG